MNTKPLVSIISVNYNEPEATAEMLRSLAQLTYKNFEVIIVDNASPRSTASLKKDFPFITHISSPHNTGFAGGNNLALQYASGEYAFLINNDTVVTPDLLEKLLNHLVQHPNCAIACPKIKYYYLPDTIQYAGGIGLHPLTSRGYDIGYMQKDDGRYDDIRKTDLPNGAAMLIPMNLIKEVGIMSELFFLYFEELDWGARFKSAGYEIHYVGSATIFHKESISTGKNSPFKTFFIYRNRLLYIRRNYKGWSKIISSTFFTLVSTPVHVVKHSVKGEWKHAQAIIKGLVWNMKHHAFTEPALHSSVIKNKAVID